MGILEVSVKLKYPPSLLPEIAGAGGFLQGDQGDLMTPGFPETNYLNGALYQVKAVATDVLFCFHLPVFLSFTENLSNFPFFLFFLVAT